MVAVLVAVYAVLARFVLHGPVTGRTLWVSVAAQADADMHFRSGGERCRRASGARAWRCDVPELGGSGGTVAYDVVVEPGRSCWRARRRSPGPSEHPASAEGCVMRWQWRLIG